MSSAERRLRTKINFLEAEIHGLKQERRALTATEKQVAKILHKNEELRRTVERLKSVKEKSGIGKILRKWYPEDYES